jgi:splicing factor 3B subunit 3
MEFENDEDEEKYGKKLYIYAGLKKGIIVRTSIDTITGKMIDLTTYILGESAVKLVRIFVQGKPAILALSERPWLIYAYGNKQIINPLSFPHLDIAVYARNPANPHTICGFYEKSLVFLSL